MPENLDKNLQADSPDDKREAAEAAHSDTQKKEHASGGGDLRELVIEHPDKKRGDAAPDESAKQEKKEV